MLAPTAPFNPATNGLQGAHYLEDLTSPSILEVYALTVHIDSNVLIRIAWLGTKSLLGSPKEPLTSLRISEGGWSDAALQDEHQVGSFATLLSGFVSDFLLLHCYHMHEWCDTVSLSICRLKDSIMAPLSQTVHGVVDAQCYFSLYSSHPHTRYSYDDCSGLEPSCPWGWNSRASLHLSNL